MNKWLLLVAFLSGCAQLQQEQIKPEQTQVNVPPLVLEHWKIKGRIGIQNGDEAWSATIIWEQNKDQFQIQLIAPLGQGTTSIQGATDYVRAQFSDGQVATYTNPNQIFQASLGVEIPIDSLRYWVTGRADVHKPAEINRNKRGVIEEIIQDGWVVSYLRYAEQYDLPSKIFVERDELEIRLVVKQWDLKQG